MEIRKLTGRSIIKFGTSGWRGRIGKTFVDENIARATQSLADYYKGHIRTGVILIGYDPREFNPRNAKLSASILAANGINARIIANGPTPSPVLAYLANADKDISGVINFTASHNRFGDNGFKFSPFHGGAAPKEATDLITDYADKTVEYRFLDYEEGIKAALISELPFEQAVAAYSNDYVMPRLKASGALESIVSYIKKNPGFKLLLDAMQGSAVEYMRQIYRSIAEEAGRNNFYELKNTELDPHFKAVGGAPNPTEPPNIAGTLAEVKKSDSTIALLMDGDADRFGIIDFGGNVISANEIMGMLTYFLYKRGKRGAVLKTIPTSDFILEVGRHFGLETIETPTGFKWCVDKVMSGTDILVGGEESAHVMSGIFRESWDDGITMGLMCLWIVADTGLSLAKYKSKVQKDIGRDFHYQRVNVELTPELKTRAMELIANKGEGLDMGEAIDEIIAIDGLKVKFQDGSWLAIRLSGTEAVARLYVEADTAARKAALVGAGRSLLGVS